MSGLITDTATGLNQFSGTIQAAGFQGPPGSTNLFQVTGTNGPAAWIDPNTNLVAGSFSGSASGLTNMPTTGLTGTLLAGEFPALTGDVTTSAGSLATTIGAGAVSYAKIQNVSAGQLLLGRSSPGAGSPQEVPIGTALNWLGTTRGSILEYGASGWTILTPGTSGYVLTSQGPGTDPAYSANTGGAAQTNNTVVAAGSNVTVGTNASGGVTTYTVNSSGGSGSQTPWGGNENAAGYGLYGLSWLGMSGPFTNAVTTTGTVSASSHETPTNSWTATSNGTNFTVTFGKRINLTMTANMYISAWSGTDTNYQTFVANLKGAGYTFSFGAICTNLYGPYSTNGVTVGPSNGLWKLVIDRGGIAGTEGACLTPPNN
jgi:hypothetical protein